MRPCVRDYQSWHTRQHYAASQLTDTENWMLVAYLQSVAEAGVIGCLRGPAAGGGLCRKLFNCHRAHGLGESLGPNLSIMTSAGSLESLIASVRDPDALVGRAINWCTARFRR